MNAEVFNIINSIQTIIIQIKHNSYSNILKKYIINYIIIMETVKIDIYNKLNRVKPSSKTLKYPFNFWTPEKIKISQAEIELKFKIKKGGGNGHQVFVY